MSANPWSIDESEFYELESYDQHMRFLLRYAILAPSGRNTQPWLFQISALGVEVFPDFSRRLLIVDRDDRELLMSLGTAITNFRVAAAHFGFETSVLYDRDSFERTRAALIAVRETCAPDRSLASLFSAIPLRHTNRAPFDGEPIDPDALQKICDVVEAYPDIFRLILPRDRSEIAAWVDAAERAQLARPAYRQELAGWIHPAGASDGLNGKVLGLPGPLSGAGSWLMRNFDTGAWQGERDKRLAETASGFLVVTAEDDRVALIQAGEALERLLLTIAATGFQYSFLNPAVEVDELRARLQTLAGSQHPPQLLLRLGSAPTPAAATPRRPLEQVLR